MGVLILSLALLPSAAPAPAGDDWPEFRGPTGRGHSDAEGLPVAWSPTENVAWKTPIHDRGWSSPVIWKGQVWVTTATKDGHRMFAVCVDRETGAIVHDIEVFQTPEPEHVSPVNSYASPTPAIEAGRVYVHYGTYGTACLDTGSGKILWTRRDLNCDHHEGPGSSPILFGDLLIVHVDGRDVQYVIALEKSTGKTAWKTPRSIDYSPYGTHARKAFSTPTVFRSEEAGSNGRVQMASVGAKAIWGYDPSTGEELWRIRHEGWSGTPRPVFGCGLVFFVTDYERPELWAVRPDGKGDVTDSHIAWKNTRDMPGQPSFLLVDDLLYVINDRGVASCLEAKTGAVVWRERLGGTYSASPIDAGGRLYFFNRKGKSTVLAAGREFKILATSDLDEEMMASPAVAGKALFIRTEKNLYRIEEGAGR
ncbi:MAG: PQQ-binding-like beta-propeller repeat protein [Planctomycetes bacterium]|nr:PQQ-binding-like beta-propeller repeat protein [Planctomycetota bacterium]